MSHTQANIIADLRYPDESQDLAGDNWSQWSSQPMIEMSALDTYQFMKTMIPYPAQKILEVGCGNGYVSLELARDGHEVTGLDKSPEIIEVAERSRIAHPETPGFGKLRYFCGDIRTWPMAESRFDVVIFNRTLHHLHGLQPALENVRRLLTKGGLLLCQDYAYDRLDDQTASWMYTMQRLLFLSNLSDEDPDTAANESQSIEAIRTAWFQKANQRLNRWEEMLHAFQTTFSQQFISWVPYLFVYIGNGIRHADPEQERALITFLRNTEQLLIEKEYIQSVGFRYVGRVQS